jgi:hypothetical protein
MFPGLDGGHRRIGQDAEAYMHKAEEFFRLKGHDPATRRLQNQLTRLMSEVKAESPHVFACSKGGESLPDLGRKRKKKKRRGRATPGLSVVSTSASAPTLGAYTPVSTSQALTAISEGATRPTTPAAGESLAPKKIKRRAVKAPAVFNNVRSFTYEVASGGVSVDVFPDTARIPEDKPPVRILADEDLAKLPPLPGGCIDCSPTLEVSLPSRSDGMPCSRISVPHCTVEPYQRHEKPKPNATLASALRKISKAVHAASNHTGEPPVRILRFCREGRDGGQWTDITLLALTQGPVLAQALAAVIPLATVPSLNRDVVAQVSESQQHAAAASAHGIELTVDRATYNVMRGGIYRAVQPVRFSQRVRLVVYASTLKRPKPGAKIDLKIWAFPDLPGGEQAIHSLEQQARDSSYWVGFSKVGGVAMELRPHEVMQLRLLNTTLTNFSAVTQEETSVAWGDGSPVSCSLSMPIPHTHEETLFKQKLIIYSQQVYGRKASNHRINNMHEATASALQQAALIKRQTAELEALDGRSGKRQRKVSAFGGGKGNGAGGAGAGAGAAKHESQAVAKQFAVPIEVRVEQRQRGTARQHVKQPDTA